MPALILPWKDKRPQLARGVFVAPGASVIGDVALAENVSVWYGAVLRGDVHSIRVGADTNIQDAAVLHGTLGEWPVVIGARCSIGHAAVVHGAVLEDDVLVGIGARVLDGAHVGRGSLIAAGALVREGMRVPPGSLVVGVPGAVKRELDAREIELVRRTPERYRALAEEHRRACEAAGA